MSLKPYVDRAGQAWEYVDPLRQKHLYVVLDWGVNVTGFLVWRCVDVDNPRLVEVFDSFFHMTSCWQRVA